MAARVRLHPSALAELGKLPADLADEILAKVELLEEFPFLGARMWDAYEGYRSLLAARNRYRIVYRVSDDGLVEVAYVRHVRRQWKLRLVRGSEP